MIQRIQSIFLLLVVIISTLLFFLPVAGFPNGTESFTQYLLYATGSSQPSVKLSPTWYLGIINGLIAIIALVTIFLFRNRKRQVVLGNINLLLIIAMIVLMFLAAENNSKLLVPGVVLPIQYKIGAWLAILLIVFTFLANRFIKKDEALVRSADRIR